MTCSEKPTLGWCFGLRIIQHTPGTYQNDPEPTVYEGIPFIWGLGDCMGYAEKGYVVVLLDSWG